MTTVAFDTLERVDKLKSFGIPQEQAVANLLGCQTAGNPTYRTLKMSILTIDTHQIIAELTLAGLSDLQAKAITNLHKQAISNTLDQVKQEYDLTKLVTAKDLDARIKETELKIELARSELKRDIAESKAELIRWVVGVVVGVGILQTTMIAGLLLKLTHAL